MKFVLPAITVFMLVPIAALAQIAAGPNYTLEKAVVANGGGASAGTTFSVEDTGGQDAAGPQTGATFQLQGGFWTSNLAPTAAAVSVSGRVRTIDGRGLRNAIVMLSDQSGAIRTTRTTSFGAFRFDEIAAGQTVILTVRSKLYRFAPQILAVNENIADLELSPLGENRSG
ncbi:MAG: carboxypeptidase regulatory-like domain-containing protein [Acidobacteria bacterium]|nr:carboxypeptidase regulatory-like domain-containing protein [Acidobacteriota bacterium]